MDDLISRQAAIEEIARRDTTDGTVKVYGGREVIEILQQLPSAQPERKTGRWIKDEKSYAGAGLSNYLCDQCGKCGGTWLSDLKPHQFPKFCMWCGVKMEVEHETDD